MSLVCIIGIDGGGKSTLARNTVSALCAQGRPAHYIYGRTVPVLSRLLMALGRAVLLRRHDPWRDYVTYAREKRARLRSPVLAWGYALAIFADYLPQAWWKVWSAGSRLVICDRYVYDTVISDLAAHLPVQEAHIDRLIQVGLALLPRPALTFLIDLPEEVAFARKNDVPHLAYLTERRAAYLRLQQRPEVVVLNGELSQTELTQAILARLNG